MAIDLEVHQRVATMAQLLREVADNVLHKACHYRACIEDEVGDDNWHERCQEHRGWYRRYQQVMS